MRSFTRVRPLSRQEVRGIDRLAAEQAGIPTLILMENAGRGAATQLRDAGLRPEVPILIACGPGNNGGDGAVMARHLDAWGFRPLVFWCADVEKLRGDAATQYEILTRSGIEQIIWSREETLAQQVEHLLSGADWVVDGLLGTGLERPVTGALRVVIEAINRSGKPVLALDLPSGLDADRGEPLGTAICAQATVTFVAPKLGFSAPGAAAYTGTVSVVDIGIPRRILEPYLVP